MRVRHKGGNKEIVRGGRDDSGYLDDSGAEGNCCGAEGNCSRGTRPYYLAPASCPHVRGFPGICQ